jgi:polyphosphate kinase
VNALVDPEMIEHLYDASEAGVEIDCIVRGACSLHPGLWDRSARIRVRSIIGEFLEHSRIFGFANGGRQEWYTGSADMMERNLDRRIEVVFPIEDLVAQARIADIIDVMLADDRRSWQLGEDATWRRTEQILAAPGTHDTFAILKERAIAAAAAAIEPPPAGPPTGSMDPRA